MQLRQLQHLVALADQGSFGRAAQAVHLSQPALSRSIESLEESLQARLVDRAYGSVRFTQAGGRKIDTWTAQHRTVLVPFDQAGDAPDAFFNANTLAELHALESQRA